MEGMQFRVLSKGSVCTRSTTTDVKRGMDEAKREEDSDVDRRWNQLTYPP